MWRCLEGDQWIVQSMSLPIAPLTPVAAMASNAVDEFVVSEILRALVGITAASAGRPNQSQPDGVVIRLVRSILVVGQNRRAKRATHVGQIDPLVRRNFKFFWLGTRTIDRPDIPVISRHLVRSRQQERGFQI